MDFAQIGKLVMLLGLVLLIAGGLIIFAPKYFPLGRFPGDLFIKKNNFTLYLPIVSSIILSIVIIILWNLLRTGK